MLPGNLMVIILNEEENLMINRSIITNRDYDGSSNGVISLVIYETRDDTRYSCYYFYRYHAIITIETSDIPRGLHHCDFLPPQPPNFPNPTVRNDVIHLRERDDFFKIKRILKNQISSWVVNRPTVTSLLNTIDRQLPGAGGDIPIPIFSYTGGKIGQRQYHNCITWAQNELSEIGLYPICNRSWILDKLCVVPKNHIGWVDDTTHGVVNFHP